MDVMPYYGLVIALARKVHQRLQNTGVDIDLDELIQEASLGLLAAAQRFEPQREVQFATFAYPRIQGAINDYLRRLDPLFTAGPRQGQKPGPGEAASHPVTGRDPTSDEIAQSLDVDEDEVRSREFLSGVTEWQIGDDDHGDLDSAAADEATPEQETQLTQTELGSDVADCLSASMESLEKRVLLLRFWRRWTLEKVGKLLDKPTQTVHNMERRARAKLKDCLEDKGWDVSDVIEAFG